MHNATSGRSNRACAKQLSIGTAEAIKIAQENDFSCIYEKKIVILHRKIIKHRNICLKSVVFMEKGEEIINIKPLD